MFYIRKLSESICKLLYTLYWSLYNLAYHLLPINIHVIHSGGIHIDFYGYLKYRVRSSL